MTKPIPGSSLIHIRFPDTFAVTAVQKIPIRFVKTGYPVTVFLKTGPPIWDRKKSGHSGDYHVQKGNIDPICISPEARKVEGLCHR